MPDATLSPVRPFAHLCDVQPWDTDRFADDLEREQPRPVVDELDRAASRIIDRVAQFTSNSLQRPRRMDDTARGVNARLTSRA